jgi:DNA-binding PadR family transcriptional regulator
VLYVQPRAGTRYAALGWLRADGLIEVDREEVVDSRLRRYYWLTPDGTVTTRRNRRPPSTVV